MHFEGENYQCETKQTQIKREEKIERERKFKERKKQVIERGKDR